MPVYECLAYGYIPWPTMQIWAQDSQRCDLEVELRDSDTPEIQEGPWRNHENFVIDVV